MSEVINVRGLSKEYRLGGNRKSYKTLRETISGVFSTRSRQLEPASEATFWALKDVTFTVKSGEVLGIVGRNGAGKSTLLKILSRITDPTGGEIEITGRVGSLLEVGTGFHPELTGRENIYLNGAILGMKRSEISKKFDGIVAFAETEKFLDTPVKFYSSGMYTRLAFAVAAHLDPEILIVDEVLAVGDAQFQKKCIGKMEEVAGNGRTVLFVSHNIAAVTTLCSRVLFLQNGSVVADGPTNEVVDRYIETGRQSSGETLWNDPAKAPGNEKLRFAGVRIVSGGQTTADIDITDEVEIEVDYRTLRPDLLVSVSIHLLDKSGACILATLNSPSATPHPDPWFNRPHPVGLFRAVCRLPGNFLNESVYSISAFLLTNVTNIEARVDEAVSFTVHETGEMRKEYSGGWIGMIRPKLPWNSRRLDVAENSHEMELVGATGKAAS